MPLLAALDVIWVEDDFIKPPGPKMVVCIAPEPGFFFRINTPRYPVAVSLLKADNPFLHHDSYLECNGPLEFDDYVIQSYLDRHGGKPFGRVATRVVPAIWAAVSGSARISPHDKELIRIGLSIS